MHVFLLFLRAVDLLSTSEHLLLKDYILMGFTFSGKKTLLIILSEGYYGLYPTGNVTFKINNNKARIN